MKPNSVTYQLIPTAQEASDDSWPVLDSLKLCLQMPNGRHIEYNLVGPNSTSVTLSLKGEGIITTELENIVSIESPTDPSHQKSNNKIVYFSNRKPGILVDFTSSRHIEERLHLSLNELVEVYRGIYVNKRYIKDFNGKYIEITTYGESKPHRIPVSRAQRKKVQKISQGTH